MVSNNIGSSKPVLCYSRNMFPPWFHSAWVTWSKQLYTIRVTQRVRKLPSDLNREEEKLILADGRRVGGDIRTLGLLDWIRLGADLRENKNFYRILQVIYLISWGLQTLRRLQYTFKQFNHFIYRVRVSWNFLEFSCKVLTIAASSSKFYCCPHQYS